MTPGPTGPLASPASPSHRATSLIFGCLAAAAAADVAAGMAVSGRSPRRHRNPLKQTPPWRFFPSMRTSRGRHAWGGTGGPAEREEHRLARVEATRRPKDEEAPSPHPWGCSSPGAEGSLQNPTASPWALNAAVRADSSRERRTRAHPTTADDEETRHRGFVDAVMPEGSETLAASSGTAPASLMLPSINVM